MSAGKVFRLLRQRHETIAIAESLTGGMVAAELVAVAGASEVFRGGVIAYATDLKAALLGVDAALLRRNGPVDPQVALAMARGVRERCQAVWGVATTGVAGPGPADGVPAGQCFVGIFGPEVAVIRDIRRAGTRKQVRQAVVAQVWLELAGVLRTGDS